MQERQYWEGNEITSLRSNEIFVFGSNPSGYHGAGAALVATRFGAQKYKGRGLYGQTYALVTKNLKAGYKEYSTGITYNLVGSRSVSKEQIIANIEEFYAFARSHKHLNFLVAYTYQTYPNGNPKVSLNGYTSQEMLEMFVSDNVPENVIFHSSYESHIKDLLNQAEKKRVLYAPQPNQSVTNAPASATVATPTSTPVKSSGGFQSRIRSGMAPAQEQSKKDLAEIDDMMVDMPIDMQGTTVQSTTEDNHTPVAPVASPVRPQSSTGRFGGGFKSRINTSQAPVDEKAAAAQGVDDDSFDEKKTVLQVPGIPVVASDKVFIETKAVEPAKSRFSNVKMFGTASAEPVVKPVVATPKNVSFGKGFAQQNNVVPAAPVETASSEHEEFQMPTFASAEPEVVVQENVKNVVDESKPKGRFGGGFKARVRTTQAPVDEKAAQAASLDDLDGEMPITTPTVVQASVAVNPAPVAPAETSDDESPFASIYDEEEPVVVNQVAEPTSLENSKLEDYQTEIAQEAEPFKEEVKPRGFSASIKTATMSEDENATAKPKMIERARPAPINGVKVLFDDEVNREELFPSQFFSSDVVEGFDGFVTVNSSGDVVAKVEPRTLVEQVENGESKINSRALKNMAMVIEKPQSSKAAQVVEEKKVAPKVDKVAPVSLAPAPAPAAAAAAAAVSRVDVVSKDSMPIETPSVSSNSVESIPSAAVSNKPTVVVEKPEIKATIPAFVDVYGDGDEYPEFLQPLVTKEVAQMNNEAELRFEREQDKGNQSVQQAILNVNKIPEDFAKSKESVLQENEIVDPFEEVEVEPVISSVIIPRETRPAATRFVRVRNMDSNQLEDYKTQGGDVASVVSTPAPAPVVSAPAPAPVVSTPAPAPVVSTPAPVDSLPNPSDYTFFFSLHSPFSNFHPAKFEYDGLTFCSNEQFMMLSKAMVFSDYDAFDRIMAHNNTPIVKDFLDGKITREQIVKNKDWADEWNRVQKAIKAEGRSVKNYNDSVWVSERENWVKEGLSQKFVQNKDLGDILLATGNTKMIEASPYDDIWGIKLSKLDALKVPESKWPGKNLLGNLLNEVRKDLSLGLIVSGVVEIFQEPAAPVQTPAVSTPVAPAPKPATIPEPEKAKPAYKVGDYHFFYSLYSQFSNFHPAPFVYKNIQFVSTEQFYMFSKAKLFQNTEVANEIMKMNEHPMVQDLINGKITSDDIIKDRQKCDLWFQMTYAIKKLGAQFKNDVWDTKKENVMGVALREKFSQNENLKQVLLKTDNRTIVEASEKDKFWGAGVGKDNIANVLPENWPGQNKLGKLLQDLREHFKLTPDANVNPEPEKDKESKSRFKPR